MALNTDAALRLMKTRLNRPAADTHLDEYLTGRIEAVVAEMDGVGIHLTDSPDDLLLLVDTAVWQYQNRDRQAGMPDWLRLRRRERWLRERRGEA